MLWGAVHAPTSSSREPGIHSSLLPTRTPALTLEPWVRQTKITTAIPDKGKQLKSQLVPACHANSSSQGHEKEGHGGVLM